MELQGSPTTCICAGATSLLNLTPAEKTACQTQAISQDSTRGSHPLHGDSHTSGARETLCQDSAPLECDLEGICDSLPCISLICHFKVIVQSHCDDICVDVQVHSRKIISFLFYQKYESSVQSQLSFHGLIYSTSHLRPSFKSLLTPRPPPSNIPSSIIDFSWLISFIFLSYHGNLITTSSFQTMSVSHLNVTSGF